ncbi:hypothetical protein NIIDNTM18_42010 [Mycolicibacterium litorale]|uniref:Uncharacterized protein n=1 Tax=Mycolicibacterium litorale TaxID=758802 RepID=A0A6S6P4Y5_9MYCO|nr:hypothetical protein [Mycolicibacterium litorale]BCI54923.1 hypothetical protein NIIDNTM18_42010 [Mycolicibacterium litorale]
MLPWKRQRLAVERVHQEVEQAHAEKTAAKRRREEAQKLASESSAVTARLRREIAKNGFTELLQQAMGGR